MAIQLKEQIIGQIEQTFEAFIQWVEEQDAALFEVVFTEGKWSTAQHLDHLIKSTNPLNKALKMPRMMLKTMFGKSNRAERSYDEVVQKYRLKLEEGGAASGRFLPETISNNQKDALIEAFRAEKELLIELIDKWKEENLSKYLLPHPLLGKMTIREMLLFTIYHTSHHLTILKERHRQS